MKYILGEMYKKSATTGVAKTKKSEPTFHDAMIEHKITWLAKLDWKADEGKRIYEELKAEPAANQVGRETFLQWCFLT